MSKYSSKINAAITGGDDINRQQAVKDLLGLDADNPYAHASKILRLGQQGDEAMRASGEAIFRLNQIAYAAEIATTRESSILASNILLVLLDNIICIRYVLGVTLISSLGRSIL